MLGNAIIEDQLVQVYQVPTGKSSPLSLMFQKVYGDIDPQDFVLFLLSSTGTEDTTNYTNGYRFQLQGLQVVQITGILLNEGDKISALVIPQPQTTTIGTGDGTTTTFTAVLTKVVKKGSVNVSYTVGGTAYTVQDNGNGNISDTIVSGTINYETGEISLTFNTAPDNGTNIDATYESYSKVNLVVTGMEV